MHEFIMGIGYAILGWFQSINSANVTNALSITVTGWLGIFVVTVVIILVVKLLTWLSRFLTKEN